MFKQLIKKEFKLEHLKCGTNYVMYVTAFDINGRKEESNKIIVKSEGDKPIPPSSIKQFVQIFVNSMILKIS